MLFYAPSPCPSQPLAQKLRSATLLSLLLLTLTPTLASSVTFDISETFTGHQLVYTIGNADASSTVVIPFPDVTVTGTVDTDAFEIRDVYVAIGGVASGEIFGETTLTSPSGSTRRLQGQVQIDPVIGPVGCGTVFTPPCEVITPGRDELVEFGTWEGELSGTFGTRVFSGGPFASAIDPISGKAFGETIVESTWFNFADIQAIGFYMDDTSGLAESMALSVEPGSQSTLLSVSFQCGTSSEGPFCDAIFDTVGGGVLAFLRGDPADGNFPDPEDYRGFVAHPDLQFIEEGELSFGEPYDLLRVSVSLEPVPEPSTAAMLSLGLGGIAAFRRRS